MATGWPWVQFPRIRLSAVPQHALKCLVFCAPALLIGCATMYQPHALTGGFEEAQMNENSFRVSFRGNGYTSTNRAEELTLLRSAELCLERGFPAFVLLRERTDIKNESIWFSNATVRGGNAYAAGGSLLFSMPSTSNLVSCIHEKPSNVFSYDAIVLYESLTTKYQVPRSAKFLGWKTGMQQVRTSAAQEQQASPARKQWFSNATGFAKNVGCSTEPSNLSVTPSGAERYEFACRTRAPLRMNCDHFGCREVTGE